jgi:hypothetical protein
MNEHRSTRIWYKNLIPELRDAGLRYCKARAGFVATNRHFRDLSIRLGPDQASALAAAAKAEMLGAMMGLRAACAEVRLEREHGRRRP